MKKYLQQQQEHFLKMMSSRAIRDTFTCKLCNSIFIKPVYLPCLNTVCEEHTDEFFDSECMFCHTIHEVPIDGFKPNDMARLFIKSNQFYLNDSQKEHKVIIDKETNLLNNLFDEFEKRDAEVDLLLFENFTNIKNKLDIQRANVKLQIDLIADKMVIKTNKYEAEFKQKLANLKKDWSMDKQLLDQIKDDIDEQFIKSTPEPNKIKSYRDMVHIKINETREKVLKLESLKKKLDECFFEANENVLDLVVFGKLSMEVNDIHLISCSNDRSIKRWDLSTGMCLETFHGHIGSIYCLEFMPNNRLISGSNDKTIKIWDLNTSQCLKTLIGHTNSVYCVKQLTDNQFISGSADLTIKIWNIETGVCLKTLSGHTGVVLFVKKLSDDEIISCSSDGTIKLWNLSNESCTNTIIECQTRVNCIELLSLTELASGSADHLIKIWDFRKGKCLKVLKGHKGLIWCLLLLNENELISAAGDTSIKMWDLRTGQCIKNFNGHKKDVRVLHLLSPNLLISGSDDESIKVWSIKTATCTKTLFDHTSSVQSLISFSVSS